MAQVLSDRRDMDFVLHEQLNIGEITAHEKFSEFNKKTIDLILNEARNFAIKELLPANREGDEEGCRFENGEVKVPECYHHLFKLMREGEWIAMTEEPELGGQGLPQMLGSAVGEMFTGANTAFMFYAGFCHGAGELIAEFGTEKQKALFLEKMYAGQWGGSMMLTEPQAGTDVGALTTTAVKNDDGTYSISGNKIFITGGDQNLTENIIHPVLARIEGAPAGSKGISLFIVPKIWVNDDGSLGEPNDVVITGIEHKMGLHGSATCSVTLGGKGKCRGLLLGEENKGLRAMFKMMNAARLGVGVQGFAVASTAYLYALNYARERIQGRHLLQMLNENAPSVAIINHPDVRRMLMYMKAHVDGMRSFLYYIGKCFDILKITDDGDTRERCNGLIEIMTPIAKAYCTDRGMDIATMAVQCYGGYGYTREYPVEQLMREVKIAQIYEGTNGIQAMDLLGRKLAMKNGRLFMALLAEMQTTVKKAEKQDALREMAGRLDKSLDRLAEVATHLGKTAMSGEVLTAFAYAHPLLEVIGDIIMAWMHLWRANLAVPKLEKDCGSLEKSVRQEKAAKNKDVAFYDGVLTTAEYYINVLLPITNGKLDSIAQTNDAIVSLPDPGFGG